jgi:hypothetical protein
MLSSPAYKKREDRPSKDETLLGSNYTCTVSACVGGNSFVVSCDQLEGYSIELRTRLHGLLSVGDRVDCWVYDEALDKRAIRVSDSDFGKLPVSDRMRPRYLRSINIVLDAISKGAQDVDPEAVSELKGIFNRCLKKDQWDWFTLFELLGKPTRPQLRLAVRGCNTARKLLKKGLKIAPGTLDFLKPLVPAIAHLKESLIAEAKSLSNATVFKGAHTGVDDEDVSGGLDPMDDGKPGYVVSIAARNKIERANKEHRATVKKLRKTLEELGYTPQYNKLIDIFCRLKTGPAIFEIKSANRSNEKAQIRRAISQLYEYRYLHNLETSTLWIVLSQPITEVWLEGYIINDRNIRLLWVEKESITGPSYSYLFSS